MQQQQQQNNLPSQEQLNALIGRRVEVQNNLATIKFAGPLVHEGKPEGSDQQVWYGVEWDEESRGKHNGTVNNYTYFTTKNKVNGGSLIKDSKGSLGINFLEGIFSKYFKDDIDPQIKKQIEDKIFSHAYQNTDQKQDKKKEEKTDEQTAQDEKKEVLVEFDEEAYFETGKKNKKMVQFYGFDKIWEKLHNLKDLLEISLYQVNISDLKESGFIGKMLPNLKVLSLEKNLIYDWDQIFQIGSELQNLEELQIARNNLRFPEAIDGRKTIKCHSNGTEIPVSPVGVFKNLKYLNFIEMDLNWKIINNIIPAFPNLEEMILCLNDMTDTQNINLRDTDLQNLVFLNLESSNLSTFEGIKVFKNLPKLEKLIMNKNKLTELGKFDGFENIKLVSLEKNLISDPKIFTELSQFPQLQILNIKHNPMADMLGKSYVRQRAVAENPKIIFINGSDLKKYERKDCEIFYMRRTFDDYFKLRNSVYYDYDYLDFINWAKQVHPTIDILLKRYGNPYELENQVKNLDNIEGESQPKNVMLKLKIIIAAGPLLGKNPLNKKFPENTTVQNLKNVFSKLLQIPGDEQIVYYKINSNDPMEILDEDHKTLSHYGIKDGSELIVSNNDDKQAKDD